MRNKAVGIVIAFVMATIGTVLLVAYVQSARDKATAEDALVDVLVVKERIDKTTLGADIATKVEKAQVPARLRAADAVENLAEVDELYTTVALLPGEQLVRARFGTSGEATRGDADVPAGLLQVAVSLDIERVVGGNLRAGDTVGVLLSYQPPVLPYETHLELNKVLVTDVQFQTVGGGLGAGNDELGIDGVDAATPQGKYIVTLAVTPAQGEQLVHGLEHGKIWLAAQPKNSSPTGTKVVSPANVYNARVQ